MGKFEPRRVGVLLETGDSVAIGNGLLQKMKWLLPVVIFLLILNLD